MAAREAWPQVPFLEAAALHARGSFAAGLQASAHLELCAQLSGKGTDESKCSEEPGDWAEELQAWTARQGLHMDLLTQVM